MVNFRIYHQMTSTNWTCVIAESFVIRGKARTLAVAVMAASKMSSVKPNFKLSIMTAGSSGAKSNPLEAMMRCDQRS